MARKALLIGINKYRSVSELRGCVNDVTALRTFLKQHRGFQNREIRVLFDERATKANIEERLDWLVRDAAAGDLLVLHFSGHGTQILDRDEADELRDGLDELICPHDMDWDGVFLTDDDLRRRLAIAEGVALEVILDCCHSGTGMVQAAPEPAPDLASADRLPRFLPPPPDIFARHEGSELQPTRRLFRAARPGKQVLWSSCAEFQTAADARIGGIFFGAFTHFLVEHLRESGGDLTRAELLSRISASLNEHGFRQSPELATNVAELRSSRPFEP